MNEPPNPQTTKDILALMDGAIVAAAVGVAMELGLFWLLDESPLPAAEVAQTLGIPLNRCHHWLQILCKLGLLVQTPAGYEPSPLARRAVLEALSQDSWAFQAGEYRESAWFVRDLDLNMRQPMSAWGARTLPPPDYFQRIQDDPEYAARFTRKLYEIHLPLADQLAKMLDLSGLRSLLDLGGGSGVVSFALLRAHPALTSVVVDVENVCQAGRALASEQKLEERITYLGADLFKDDLPTGFDLVLLCDLGICDEGLFRRAYQTLKPGGRLAVVEKFAPGVTSPPPSRLFPAFLGSLQNPGQPIEFTTADEVQSWLEQAGFRDFALTPVPPVDQLPWNVDWSVLEARKGGLGIA